jgi:ABC-type nitrate/sulfonate/bicarbonate transport system ATPase subunit
MTVLWPIRGRSAAGSRFGTSSSAETEPFVLVNINLTIEPGQFVTIMGPSGGDLVQLIGAVSRNRESLSVQSFVSEGRREPTGDGSA